MTNYDLMNLLGRAFADGKAEALVPYLAKDCIYVSEYANNRLISAEAIIQRMQYVHSNTDETNRYTYSVVKLDEIADYEKTQSEVSESENVFLNEYGIYLYQYDSCNPVAVVLVCYNEKDKICKILLSRNKNLFDICFYGEEIQNDSPYDLPSTVKPLIPHDRQVKELRRAFSGQHLDDIPEEEKDNLYIWRQADLFIKDWLNSNGYYVRESQIQEDCIGYRCYRKGCMYTVYLYAYGKEQTSQLDGDYCEKLAHNEFSESSTVLIVYLNVKRYMQGGKVAYKVCNYSGKDDSCIELWRLSKINEKPILEFYPCKEMMDRTYELMYAFNYDSLDVYDCIITEKSPKFNGYDERGFLFNDAFYGELKSLHTKYGDMKIGYVRYNDVVYSKVPYLERYGFFGFEVFNSNNRIHTIYSRPFEGGEKPYAEFIKTQETTESKMYSHYPKLIEAIPLISTETEKFAVKLVFDNGETKKYVLPIDDKSESDEVIGYRNYVFTNKIWQSAEIVATQSSEYRGYPIRGQAITFKNGFFLSAYLCYADSKPYTEPVLCNETVYEDESIKLNRLWRWKAKSVYADEETGIMKVLISGDGFNLYGKSTYATCDGKRITSLDFDYIDDFNDGLACVGIVGRGYGYIDVTGKLIISAIYENAGDFKNGKALVKRNGKSYYVDKYGNEIEIGTSSGHNYQDVGELCEGLCRVSTLKLGFMDLAYHSDYSNIAGTWGYVDENGNEVISPQYIYANDFEGGIAIVCKGKWTIDKKWDNEYSTGRYWTEEELWGAIDHTGKEMIPFIFDEIKSFWDTTEMFMAHYGGWENGKWGVISKNGEWLAEPVFEDIGYGFHNGLFAFYQADKWNDPDRVPMGVYDLNQHKIIFEPQFLDVNFRDDGYLEVEVYDEKSGRRVEKIIDLDGKDVFPSVYSSIYGWKEPYEVVIRDENGARHGLIDKDGNVILPCKYNVAWNGISYEKRRIIIHQDGKQAVIDFDDNVIIPPKYHEICGLDKILLTVRDGEKDNYKEGLITHDGTVVIAPNHHRISWCKDNLIVCCSEGNCEMIKIIIKDESSAP